MTTFWCVIWMGLLTFACIAFQLNGHFGAKDHYFKLGKEEGFKEGYNQGREDVNAHIDSYVKGTEWKV